MAVATSTAIAIGATVIGAGVSAMGAIQQGKAAQQSANFQQQILNRQAETQRQQADRERQLAEQNETTFRRDQSRAMARRRAIMGGSGVDTSTGSPLLANDDFAGEVEFAALNIRNQGEVGATRLEQQAGLTEAEGSLAQLKGKQARQASFFRAGSSLLGGIGSAASIHSRA